MGRPQRSQHQSGWHHVVNRGVDRQSTFFADRDRIEFGRLLGVGHTQFGVEIHAYCLMTNHYHLLLRCPDGGLSAFMQHLGSVFTRHVNDRIGRDGPLFRGRFASRRVLTHEYIIRAVRYIHRNPWSIVPGGPLEQFRWSSHRTYLQYRRSPDWLYTRTVLGWFDDDIAAFHEFVTGDRTRLHAGFDGELMDATVELVLHERTDVGERARQGMTRTVSLLVLDQLTGADRTAYLRRFDYPTDRLRDEAIWRARRNADRDPQLAHLAAHAIDLAA